jgi:putative oxygen-independent coproporphyrinogen III oxidase
MTGPERQIPQPTARQSLPAEQSLPPLALYVHFPWCVRKCPYCDFNSHTLQGELPEHRYIETLQQDLQAQSPGVHGRAIGSVFLGGGTPSLFSPDAIARFLDAARDALELASDAEVTLEANPGTIEHGRFAEYRAAGINRVSLGAQSFADSTLQRLGRIHAAADTLRAVEELRQAGIDNFNLDLMYALPGQDAGAAVADIEMALSLEPAHISHYELTLEPGTLFAAHPPDSLPDADRAWDIQQRCQQRLAEAGYDQYEVSAYARTGRRCRHNLNYWRFGDYLGVGAGAHGKLSRLDRNGLRIGRTAREREPRRYQAAAHAAPALHPVAEHERPFEYLMNALRLRAGFCTADFEQRTGLASAVLEAGLDRLLARGLMEREADCWRASALGFRFLNDVIGEFLASPP